MTNEPAAMTPEQFIEWMDENAFGAETLSEALRCNRVTVFKWRSGKHPINYTLFLALQHLAADTRALAARRRALAAADKASDTARTARARARTAGVPA